LVENREFLYPTQSELRERARMHQNMPFQGTKFYYFYGEGAQSRWRGGTHPHISSPAAFTVPRSSCIRQLPLPVEKSYRSATVGPILNALLPVVMYTNKQLNLFLPNTLREQQFLSFSIQCNNNKSLDHCAGSLGYVGRRRMPPGEWYRGLVYGIVPLHTL